MGQQVRTFSDSRTAEAWLRWVGYSRYMGMWTWSRVNDPADLASVEIEDGKAIVYFQRA